MTISTVSTPISELSVSARFKIPPKRVKCDDCLLYPDRQIADGKLVSQGNGVAIHAGEWVEIIPVQTMREMIVLGQIAGQVNSEAETADKAGRSAAALDELCKILSERTIAWNWTDNAGVPLPQPYKNPDVLASLSNDELLYLIQASKGETPEERKKG